MFGDQTGGLAAQKGKHEVAAYDRIPSTLPDRVAPGSVLSDRMIAMRDGTHLATDVYLPEGDGPFPVVLTRMPYGKTEPYCFMPVIADHWVRQGLRRRGSGRTRQVGFRRGSSSPTLRPTRCPMPMTRSNGSQDNHGRMAVSACGVKVTSDLRVTPAR